MKRYISATTNLAQGAYLLSRTGRIEPTILHVPSTTYLSRGIKHLCPTDAEFLLNHGKISEEDAETILKYCVVEYMTNELGKDSDYLLSLFDVTKFTNYADLKYAPKLRAMFMKLLGLKNELSAEEKREFEALDDAWYEWLQNQFVKVSIIGNTAEFRISSNDGYDWNPLIIDQTILETNLVNNPKMRYNIVRESRKGYKAYFLNASLDELLENDTIILASTYLERKVIAGAIRYVDKNSKSL